MSEYIDKITDKDTGDSRIISPAAEDVRVDNENFEGGNLGDVLDEIAEGLDEAGSGGYTPPPGGIPKTDLAPAVQQTLDDVANKVDKVTGKGLSSNDYTDTDKAKVDNLKPVATSGSYNDLTDKPTIPTVPTMDSVPTAGNTTHMVSSDGVASALNSLLQNLRIVNNEWYIGNTATGVSAQGPTGNVNISDAGDLVTILVNDLTTGGAGNILTAEMGKVLKIAVQTLIDSMGEYCFPNGRPTLSWEGPKADIIHTFNNSHVTLSNTALHVDIGSAFEATLGTDNNLYIIDDDSVVVKMGGVDITSTAYNPVTGKVAIAEVTDAVEITANAITYVGYGESDSPLVSMFDGLNRGGTTGQWKDTQEPNRVLTLDNCTENTDNVQFNGRDSTAFCTNSSYNKIAVKPEDGTIEAVIGGMAVNSSTTFANPICNGYGQDERLIGLVIMYSTVDNINRIVCGFCQMKSTESSSSPSYTLPLAWDTNKSTITAAHLSVSDARAYIDGVAMSRSAYFTGSKSHADSKFGVISYYSSNGNLRYSAGKMYCARIYSRQLTADEVEQNYKVDQKRFNL